MFMHVFGSARARRSKREHSFRPQLECLEARTLLDATPQAQLGADLAKLGVDFTRASIDAAVVADEVAIASSVETPEGIAALAGLAPIIKNPAMVYDIASLGKDLKEGNITGMSGDLASLSRDTIFAIYGDLVTLEQDGMAVANDIMQILSAPVTPHPQSSPQSAITINSFTVSPSKPAAGEDVSATASISGAPPGTGATLSVQGTDGYTDSNFVDISGSGSVSLDIPGGAAGVTDTITLSVAGLPTQQRQVVYG